MPSQKLSIYEKFKTHRKHSRIKPYALRLAGEPPTLLSDRGDRTLARRRASGESERSALSESTAGRLSAVRLSDSESNERTFSGRAFKDESPCKALAAAQLVRPSCLHKSAKSDGNLKGRPLQDRKSAVRHDRTAKRSSTDETVALNKEPHIRKPLSRTLSKAPNRSPYAHLTYLLAHLLLITKVNAQSIIKQTSVQQATSSASSLNAKSLASIKNAYTGKCHFVMFVMLPVWSSLWNPF